MDSINLLSNYLDYKTKYFESLSEFVKTFHFDNKMYFSIFCCNIRSINKHFDEFTLYLNSDKFSCNLDIIILTETWHNIDLCDFEIPGYRIYFSTVKRNQNDGIIVFTRSHLSVESIEYKYTVANILNLKLEVNNIPLNILCVYRSPTSDICEFITTIENIFKVENKNNEISILIGDMNINILGTNSTNNEYLDMLSEYGFKSLINIFTRTPINCKHSCLDHIFMKDNSKVDSKIEAGVLQTNITDHFSTVVVLDINNIIKPTNNVYKIINYNKLNELIKKETWHEIYSMKDVNKCYDNFIYKIVSALNMATITKTKNSKNKHLKEWMTAGLLISLRQKQNLSHKVKKHPLNHKLRNHYIKYKNKFTTVLRMAKKNYYESKFIEVSDSPKHTWKLISDITSTKKKMIMRLNQY